MINKLIDFLRPKPVEVIVEKIVNVDVPIEPTAEQKTDYILTIFQDDDFKTDFIRSMRKNRVIPKLDRSEEEQVFSEVFGIIFTKMVSTIASEMRGNR